MQKRKYGFWIIPENDLYNELNSIIRKYSIVHKTPIFVPHLTLHGVVSSTDEEVVEVVRKVVKSLTPFNLELGQAEFSNTYYQCVFARVKTSASLFNANAAINNGFKVEKQVFMPHMSLVYGDFTVEEREKIAHEITIDNKFFEANKVSIVRADSPNPDLWAIVEQMNL